MLGICGWVAPDGLQHPTTILERMSSGCAQNAGPIPARLQSLSDASGRWGGAATHLATRNGLLSLVDGSLRWSDPELERIRDSSGSAASLAEAYVTHGRELLARARGNFSLAIVDCNTGSVLLAIDRMGVGSLAYASTPRGELVFAADCATILAHGAVSAAIDPQAVFNYTYFHMVPSPGTIYRNVRKLEPATWVAWSAGKIAAGEYWRPRFSARSTRPLAEHRERLFSTLRTAVNRHTPDTRCGAFLSGGLDSSTISGLLAEINGSATRTLTIGFDEPGYDEMHFARVTARHFRVTPTEYYVSPDDVVTAIPRIASAYDEPFGNSSALPTYYCARTALRVGLLRLLAGDGGDELFGGNERYAKQKLFQAYHRVPEMLRTAALEPVIRRSPWLQRLTPVRKLDSYIKQANVPMPLRLQTYNFLYREQLSHIFEADFLAAVDTSFPEATMRDRYEATPSPDLLDRMLFFDWKFTLADNDLRKVSRMCALAGVGVEYPMLDDEVIDMSLEVPSNLKVRGQQLRYFYKRATRGWLPEETLRKEKHGFGLPFGVWLGRPGKLQELSCDSLRDLSARDIVRRSFLDGLIEQHRTGDPTFYGTFVWVLMMLEQWLAAQKPHPPNAGL